MRTLAIAAFAVLLTGAAARAQDVVATPTPSATPDPVATPAVVALPVVPLAPPASDDATFAARFVCPEALNDPDERIAELAAYMEWARDHHPEWNLRKRLDVRYGLLRRHACESTLAHLAASARPPFKP